MQMESLRPEIVQVVDAIKDDQRRSKPAGSSAYGTIGWPCLQDCDKSVSQANANIRE